MKVTVEQITENFSAVADTVKSLSTEEQTEVVEAIKEVNLNEFTIEKFNNLKDFLANISDENRKTFVLNVVDNVEEKSQDLKNFMKDNYKAELTAIMDESNTTES